MTTQELIHQYAKFLRNATNWQTQADALRDKIARRLLIEENFVYNGTRATSYKVRATRVKAHDRRGYKALRITL